MSSDNLLHLYDFFFPHTPSKIVILPCVQSYSDSLSAFQGTFLWKWILRWLAQAQCLCLCRCSSQGAVYVRAKAADKELVVNFYHCAKQKNCRVCVSLVYFFFLNYIFFYKAKKTRKPFYICEYTCEIMTRPLCGAYVFLCVQASCLTLHSLSTITIGIYICNKLCCKHEHFNFILQFWLEDEPQKPRLLM